MSAAPPRSRRRWSDNDRHFGPFTYSHSRIYRSIGIALDSGDGDESPGCHFRLSAFGHTLIVELPAIIKPWRQWVDTSKYEWSRNPNGGYWDVHSREYSISISDSYVYWRYGPQTHDSSTSKSACREIPWMAWRYDTTRLYDDRGALVWIQTAADGKRSFDEQYAAQEKLKKVVFAFKDYDDEDNTVSTFIIQREWLKGIGWFKWLSLFTRRKVSRSLDLTFSKEVGPEKGSWKGGTIGHSIEMLPGELHEAAFRRYCDLEHRSKYRPYGLTFVGKTEGAAQ